MRVTLNPMGNGCYSGLLIGHPCPNTSVHVTRLTHDTRKVRLYQDGMQVGEGLLRLSDGRWTGQTTEFAGTWHIEARAGSTELTFRENAPEVAA
jgi:hypothetical protein